MLKIVPQREIKESWEKYKPHIEIAFESLIKVLKLPLCN